MLYEKLNYIIAIAEERNLTQAAKRLYISQPTLTLYLNRLENELGVKLFDRTKSPVTLTDAGAYYLEKMKKIYASEQALRSQIHFIANPPPDAAGGNRPGTRPPLAPPVSAHLLLHPPGYQRSDRPGNRAADV